MNQILCIGEALIDGISIETSNSLEQVNNLEIVVGGSVTNFCTYIKKYEVEPKLIASVGDDGFGKKIIHFLQQQNISTQYVNVVAHHQTSFIAVSKTTETPDFIAYRDADKQIFKFDIDVLNKVELVHSTAFCLSQAPASQTVLDVFTTAHQQNKIISIDWNYAPSIWRNKENANTVFKNIQQFTPLLKFSLDDVSRFLEKPVTEQEAINFLSTVKATAICLTCGAKGVYYKTANTNWNFIAAPIIQVKNATGAGDAFWAGFVSAYIKKYNTTTAVEKGIEVASLKLQNLL